MFHNILTFMNLGRSTRRGGWLNLIAVPNRDPRAALVVLLCRGGQIALVRSSNSLKGTHLQAQRPGLDLPQFRELLQKSWWKSQGTPAVWKAFEIS